MDEIMPGVSEIFNSTTTQFIGDIIGIFRPIVSWQVGLAFAAMCVLIIIVVVVKSFHRLTSSASGSSMYGSSEREYYNNMYHGHDPFKYDR